jgi:hypothetical protein
MIQGISLESSGGGGMKTLCVVPCGARKIWDKDPDAGPTQARDAYIGPFAKKCREYARRFYPNRWCILSTKYGFLGPLEIVPGPYDVSFNDPESGPITADELTRQALERGLGVFDEVVVLGGKNYVAMIEQAFAEKRVRTPLKGAKGIGYMMGMMNEAIAKGVPLEG